VTPLREGIIECVKIEGFKFIFDRQVKVKSLCFVLTEHHAIKAYWGSGGIAPRIVTSAIDGGEWSASRPGRFISQGKSPWYPLDRMVGGPQSRSGRGGEEKNSQPGA
jgi:hypothetical protein